MTDSVWSLRELFNQRPFPNNLFKFRTFLSKYQGFFHRHRKKKQCSLLAGKCRSYYTWTTLTTLVLKECGTHKLNPSVFFLWKSLELGQLQLSGVFFVDTLLPKAKLQLNLKFLATYDRGHSWQITWKSKQSCSSTLYQEKKKIYYCFLDAIMLNSPETVTRLQPHFQVDWFQASGPRYMSGWTRKIQTKVVLLGPF